MAWKLFELRCLNPVLLHSLSHRLLELALSVQSTMKQNSIFPPLPMVYSPPGILFPIVGSERRANKRNSRELISQLNCKCKGLKEYLPIVTAQPSQQAYYPLFKSCVFLMFSQLFAPKGKGSERNHVM